MERSKRNTLLKRVISSVILAPLVIGALWYGWGMTSMLILIVGAMLAWEWSTMIPNQNNAAYCAAYFLAVASTVCLIYPSYVYYPLLIILGASLFVWYAAKAEKHRRLLTLGVVYLALGMGTLGWLYTWIHPLAALWLIVSVWSVDIGAYVVGTTLKGPKLAPRISPNKTWAGLLGAIVFAVLTSLAFAHYVEPKWSLWLGIAGGVLAVVAQCGDLLESKIKRYLNIKDSSNLIPGHGGILDRVDGLIFAAPFVLIAFVVLVYGYMLG